MRKSNGTNASFTTSFLLIFLPVAAALVGVALFIIQLQCDRFTERLMEHEANLLANEAETIQSGLETPVRDALFLARLVELHQKDEGTAQAMLSLRKEFTLLGQSNFIYDQVRLLDTAGIERIRVNFDKGRASLPAGTELQDKSQRYYFQRGIKAKDSLYMSRFDLNIEQGVIEIPHKPTIRFAAPFMDGGEKLGGVVVLNFRGGALLEKLVASSKNSGGDLMLVNGQGKWLLGPRRHLDFSFLIPGTSQDGFEDEHPRQWKTILETKTGQFMDEDGLFTYRTLRLPAVDGGGRKIVPESEEILTLVSVVKPGKLMPSWRNPALASLAATLAVVAVMALLLAQARVAQKVAVAATAEAQQRLAYALDGARDGVWDWDAVTNKVAFSRRWKEMLGYGEDEISGDLSEWDTRIHPDDKEQVYADLTLHMEGKTPYYENTHRMRCKDGSYRWILDRGKVVQRAEDGTPLRAVGTHTDVTDRIEAELALADSRRSLAQAQSIAQLGNWELDPATGQATCSDEMYRILGLDPTGPRLTHDFYMNFIHGDDRERLDTIIRRVSREGGSYADRHRLIRPGGEERWIEGRGEARLDDNGKVVSLSGTIQDVTERVYAQLAIKEREAMLRAISQSSHDSIVVIDDSDSIILWNPAAERLFGYGMEEALGKSMHELIALPEDRKAAHKGLKDFGKTGKGPVVGTIQEMTAVRKNGETFPVERSVASFIRDGQWYAVGSLRDITERKEAERKLRELATTDGLTGLNNRRHFMERGAAELRRARRYGDELVGIMFDVDHFKKVNDTYGHDAGDDVLRTLSSLALKTFRDVDIVGRLGGEEFGVILPQATADEGMQAAERMRSAVEEAVIPTAAGDLQIHISVGVASLDQDVENIEALLKSADLALYSAKNTGRNKVVAFDTVPAQDKED